MNLLNNLQLVQPPLDGLFSLERGFLFSFYGDFCSVLRGFCVVILDLVEYNDD